LQVRGNFLFEDNSEHRAGLKVLFTSG
jgi:hypothetical protein